MCRFPSVLCLLWETLIPFDPKALPIWHALMELLLTGKGELRSRPDKNIGLPATDEAKPYKEKWTELIEALRQTSNAEAVLANLKRLPNPSYDESSWQVVDTFAKLLKIAAAELWLVFQQHGEVDFVQISQRALFALGDVEENPSDLALKLDYKIQHLLVDEFQDTSPTQIKLIEKLTQGWADGDGRTLFAVGDPMQSIYRFRKANVGLFLQVAQRGIGGVSLTPLKLWRNNRSQKAVIDWINNAFVQVFPRQDSVSRGAIAYRDFVDTKDTEKEAGVFVHAMLDKSQSVQMDDEESDESIESDVRQLEANKIIQIIQETWSQNPERKIAVLVRARSHLHTLVAEIRRHHPDLNFQAVEIEELANRQVVQDLLSLTNALHQRADRVHWLALLRAPWCGLTLQDLHTLIGRDQYSTVLSLMHDEARLEAMTDDGRQRLLHVRKIMDEALLHRGRMSTSRWVRSVWLMLGGQNCLWSAGDVRDVQAFFERIDRMEAMGQFTTELLAQEVQKLYAAPDAKATERLQFMTIHKSKGLEFDTVILPGLDKTTGKNDQQLLIWEEVSQESAGADVADVDLVVAPLPPKGISKSKKEPVTPYAYLQSLEKQRAQYEDARVLYVAATRAERCLHLLGAVKLDKHGQANPKKNTFLEMLWPVLVSDFDADALPKQDQHIALNSQVSSLRLEDFVPQLVRLAKPALPAILEAEISAVASANNGDEVATISPSLEADIGTLTHRYLELMAKHGHHDWTPQRITSLEAAMQRWLLQQGHPHLNAKQGTQTVVQLLIKTLLSTDGQWVLQARAGADQEFALEFFDGEVKKRIIDRTFIENGVRWIIDYKTTQAVADLSEVALTQAAGEYQQQLAGYAALFEDEGLPIKTAVFFVNIGRLIEVSV